jgi:hypothetical protein
MSIRILASRSEIALICRIVSESRGMSMARHLVNFQTSLPEAGCWSLCDLDRWRRIRCSNRPMRSSRENSGVGDEPGPAPEVRTAVRGSDGLEPLTMPVDPFGLGIRPSRPGVNADNEPDHR